MNRRAAVFSRARANWRSAARIAVLACGLIAAGISIAPAGDSNVSVTVHNLSKDGTAPVKATSETQVCVFCHTPHNANATAGAPLWNRATNVQSYTRYNSASLDATVITDGFKDQPGGSSLLCLSCHDGTIALGQVSVMPKTSSGTSIDMTGDGKIPAGLGVNTGYTRPGTDLTNDHPISITYDNALATADGELLALDANQRAGTLIGPRASGYKPTLPLERTGAPGLDGLKTGQVQCATCHDPHLNKSKFLRLNRLQANAAPSGGSFSEANDIICLACHTKLGVAWAQSAHASQTVADETYSPAAAALRGFPAGTQVWQASCLNCHDTHSVQGSRRLLREGVNGDDAALATVASGAAAGAVYRPGFDPQPVDGNNATSAVENTCFQCHREPGGINAIVAAAGSTVPKIKSLFDLTYGMPARSDDQADPSGRERHNITNADLTESRASLGRGDTSARHAECPDCHNPHRLVRNSKFNNSGDNTKRTHETGSGAYGNVASGVLRGGWGVEPIYNTSPKDRVWPAFPDDFAVKKGDPGTSPSVATSEPYLTREYQLCFKCHSNYANGDTKESFPAIGYATTVRGTSRRGTTLTYSNGMLIYTNVAAEFASVNAGVDANGLAITGTDQGEASSSGSNVGTACGGGDCAPVGSVNVTPNPTPVYQTTNHRSWHPVMYPTGRDRAERKMGSSGTTNIRAPFEANMGKQTMYCADCHGQGSSYTPGVGPVATEPQGPHGSSYPFLLRGDWSPATRMGALSNQICGYCHQPGSGTASPASGFGSNHDSGCGGDMSPAKNCMFCHVAVPHGWKNKAFLVNMNCVGKEGGKATDCTSHGSGYGAQYVPPYYNAAKIRVNTWSRSGSWSASSCGGDAMTNCSSSY